MILTLPRRLELHALVTEFILSLYSLGTPSSKAETKTSFPLSRGRVIAIKPERLLEPLVERREMGGRGLTLSVGHYLLERCCEGFARGAVVSWWWCFGGGALEGVSSIILSCVLE